MYETKKKFFIMKIFIYAPSPLGLHPVIQCCQFVLDFFVKDNQNSRVLACIKDPDKSLDILSTSEPFIFIFYDISLDEVKKVLAIFESKYPTDLKKMIYITSYSSNQEVSGKLKEIEKMGVAIFRPSGDYLSQHFRHTLYEYLVKATYSLI